MRFTQKHKAHLLMKKYFKMLVLTEVIYVGLYYWLVLLRHFRERGHVCYYNFIGVVKYELMYLMKFKYIRNFAE